jgi:bifunctional non-homologous end joining protein LigD
MALDTYRAKRDFTKTGEPSGEEAVAAGDSYLIQKHDARRLHYDLRLELDGVLKSWAVTRGPSLVPGEKRLAVHVEDHPLAYGDFEGTIPKGEYGGGTVLLWDRGSWSPIGDPHKGLAKGHLEFELHGEKLRGRWHLVRMHGKPREKRENWLLIKGDDEVARTEDQPDVLEERPESVKTGRVVEDIAGEAPGWSSKTGKIERRAAAKVAPAARKRASKPPKAEAAPEPGGRGKEVAIKGAKKKPLPDFVEPLLATLVPKTPSGDRWVHEIKFDGYRLQARIDRGKVKLLTRTGLDWTERFGKAVHDALVGLPVETAIMDGELVVENSVGASDFSALQADLSEGRSDRFVFYAFDLLYRDGTDLTGAPLIARKEALKEVLSGAPDILRYSEHFEEDGSTMLRHACRLSLEGLVSKLRDAPYRSGRRKDWLKSKCSKRQEFVIAGYVPSTTSRQAIGSLVLGLYEDGKLRHVGRVGTGFSMRVAEDLYRRLEEIRIPKSPFAERLPAEAARDARFVEPKLVAEVEFRAWTGDRNIRHAAFRGLREDKPAEEVVQEAEPATKASRPRIGVTLTHPDRVYWPEDGVTKEGLANYYAEVWPQIAPHLAARPLALVRCPDGIVQSCFFQKHAWRGMNRAIKITPDPKDGEDLLTVGDLDGLIALVQAGTLEIHPWGSTLAALEKPDTMIFDLDPGPGLGWADIIAGAFEVRQRLEAAGLPSFVKTSGGKGLHVVVPLTPKAGWDEVKGFAKAVADEMTADSPDRFIATATKAKRGGKIFVDYLRNGRGATAIAPYSTRARPGAAVSMPIDWNEIGEGLGETIGPAYFTIDNAPNRLANLARDPWADFRKAAVPLPTAKRKRGK